MTWSRRTHRASSKKPRLARASKKTGAALTGGALIASAFAGLAIPATAAPVATAPAASGVTITPNPSYKSDPFEGWGTSLVWFANATGEYPDDLRNDMRDKLFSDEGLNLNIARYNIGGGDATDVPPYLRAGGAVPGWWNTEIKGDDGELVSTEYDDREDYRAAWNGDNPDHYNFDADMAQRWWLEHIKDDVTHFEAFSNSPPYFLTESGFVSGGINNATSEQLAPGNMEAFADYLVTVTEHLEGEYGVDFKTIDPFNEPNTNYWSAKLGPNGWPTSDSRQEGAHIGPEAQDEMIQVLADRLESSSTNAVISAMDETNPGTFITNFNAYSDASRAAVGQYNVHSYGQGSSLGARDIAKAESTPLWMSEVEGDWASASGFDVLDMDNGLGLSQHIVDDLRNLEPTAWVFWQPVEDTYNMEKTEKLNWGTVFIDFDCDEDGNSVRRLADGDEDPSCKVQTNAKYNTFRNFSHYILPGDQLIPSGNNNATAAVNADGDGMNAVYVNKGASSESVTIDLSGFGDYEGATVTPVVTTAPESEATIEDNALVEGESVVVGENGKATLPVPAGSVTTFVVEGVSGVSEDAPQFADGDTYQLTGVGSGLPLSAKSDGGVEINELSADTAARQTWTVTSVDGAGTNHQEIVLTNAEGQVLTEVSGDVKAVKPDGDPAANASMRWIPSTQNGKDFSLQPSNNRNALDVNGQGTTAGSRVGLYQHSGGSHQRWLLQDTTLEGFKPITINAEAGVAPALPETVTPIYAYGVGQNVDVTWDTKGVDWDTVGTVVLKGSGVDGYGREFDNAELTVEIGGATSSDPTSMTVRKGISVDIVAAQAPTVVQGQLGASEARFDMDVEWDWNGIEDTDFAKPGVVKVPGTATAAGGSVDAVLNVLVTESMDVNIAPDSEPSATDVESGYSVADTINGVTTDKAWSNWKSGGQNASDTLTYEWDSDNELTSAKIFFMKDGTDSWPSSVTPEYRDLETGEWTALEPVEISEGKDDAAPTVEINLGVQTDAVRFVMTARDNTHMIVSETEVYSPDASPASYADLARLTVGGKDVEGFDPEKDDYEVTYEGTEYPTVNAVALDKDATVEITQASAENPVATVAVTSADGKNTVTYTVSIDLVAPPALPSVAFTSGGEALSEGTAVLPGQEVTAVVSDAEEGAAGEFSFHSDPVVLSEGTANEAGTIELTGKVPEDAAVGTHALVVTLDDEELGRVNVTVQDEDPGTEPTDPGTEPSEPGTDPSEPGTDPSEPGTGTADPTDSSTDPSAAPSPGGDLPNSGGNAALAVVGLVLLTAGAAVLMIRRRTIS
ncbi:MAG: glycoside hydrolase [Ancrocorticia populi]|uniref:glycoside hydrolase n=1 Tax=Ancrocorticia populi TaxID=2175228 RepID=UPI003F8E4A20